MYFKKVFIIILFFIALFVSKSFGKENKILIKINNEIITTIDILNEIKFLSMMNKEFTDIKQNRKIEIAKNSLIKEKIKFIEISKFKKNLNIENNIYENIVKNYFKNIKIDNLEDLEIFLKKKELNSNFIKDKIAINTLWN